MKNFLVLGLGSFGMAMAKELRRLGNEVAVVDSDEDRINRAREFVDKALIANATQRETLDELHIAAFDTIVVNLGADRIDASILATLHLKQMGARHVVVKANTEDHATILALIGADQVVFPERDMAVRISYVLSTNVLDQIPVAPGFRIVEMGVPLRWVGKSLAELDLSNRFQVQVIIIKQAVPEQILLPTGKFVLKSSDVMEVLGQDNDLHKFQESIVRK